MSLTDTFTSTGAKFFCHEDALTKLRNGQGMPITSHIMLTDVCNHKCAFCSVQHRQGDSLTLDTVINYLGILKRYGLKSVILSGGGNPILYKCKFSGSDFNDAVDVIHKMGLEIGLITNGMPLTAFNMREDNNEWRKSWKTVSPDTLDKLTWVRISMSGFDHPENEVYVPDIDPAKTTLGFSYVAHDIYDAPEDKKHGKVSTEADVLKLGSLENRKVQKFEDRWDELLEDFVTYCEKYQPRYLRLLPNCLEPHLIQRRVVQLNRMADEINLWVGREVAFVQHKPPKAPTACLLGSIHPVLNANGLVFPCDSAVLNEEAGHKFDDRWSICRWDEIGKLYENKLPHSLIADPQKQCPGCVFTRTNELLQGIRDGTIELGVSKITEHPNFV